MSDFDRFWSAYPRKVGKLAAQKAFHKALAQATVEEILEGVERYRRHKPTYADWCHPQTFLNQGRWMDEYESAKKVDDIRWRCGHTPHCGNRAWCDYLNKKQAATA